jgi:Flp pilus assembly protein TadG
MIMKWLRIRRNPLSPFRASEAGTVAVEFIILFPLFLLIVVGIVEFGHMWYVDHVITNASREGARVGVVYPNTLALATPAAKNAINDYIMPPNGSGPSVIPGVIVTSTITSVVNNGVTYLQVQIKASNVALVLGKVIPAFETMTLQATTTMRMELQS